MSFLRLCLLSCLPLSLCVFFVLVTSVVSFSSLSLETDFVTVDFLLISSFSFASSSSRIRAACSSLDFHASISVVVLLISSCFACSIASRASCSCYKHTYQSHEENVRVNMRITRQTDRQTDRQMDGQTDGWTYRWMDRQMDGQTDGWTDSWMDRQMDGQTDK